jgi:lipid-A-disaccharide synthase
MIRVSAATGGAREFMPNIFISAGEASGEHYGALVVTALRERLAAAGQSAGIFGMGGARMEEAGLERIVRAEEMAVMGLTEVLRHLPHIYGEFRKLKRAIRERCPQVAILIDFPGFHFVLAKFLHSQGVPVVYFVSPQLWAWKQGRIRKVRKFVDRMLCIFPFEEIWYRERGVEAEFVGHPLAEMPLPAISRQQFAAENGLNPAKTWIGLLPGSRRKEIFSLLPEMLRAAQELAVRALATETGAVEFLLPLAPTLNEAQREQVRQMVVEHGSGLEIRLLDEAPAALHHSRVSIVASGTATLEAALIGNPFVVVYRVSPLTFAIAKRVVKVTNVAMANLIAGKLVVPELIQDDFTAANIVQHIEQLLPEGSPRQQMMEELARVRGLLHTERADSRAPKVTARAEGAIERVADVALQQMSR